MKLKTKAGVRVIACLMTDGCIPSKQQNIIYTNKYKELVEQFASDLKELFGDFKYKISISKWKEQKYYRFCGSVTLGRAFCRIGMKPGSKLISNLHVPEFIFEDKEFIKEFLGYVIANEGCVDHVKHTGCRRVRIGMGTFGERLNFLDDCKRMFEILGIECSLKLSRKAKAKKKDHVTNVWTLEIGNRRNLEKFHKLIKIPLKYKQDRLDEMVSSYKQRGSGELYREIKELCFEHHKQGLDITVPIFRDKMKLDDETIRENMDKLEKNNVLRRIGGGNGNVPVYYEVR